MPKRKRELRKITVSVEWFTVCLTDETFVDALSHLIVMKLIECYYYHQFIDEKTTVQRDSFICPRSRQIETGDRLQTFAYRV